VQIVGAIFDLPEKHAAKLNTWIGSTEQEMISSWGGPSNVYENNGIKYITWGRSYERSHNTYSCSTTFEFSNGIARTWSYRGNDCW